MGFGNILKGIGIFFASILLIYLSAQLIPSLYEPLHETAGFDDTNMYEGIWTFLIIIWFALGVVVPSAFIITGIRELSDIQAMMKILAGAVIFILMILLTIRGAYIIEFLGTLQTSDLSIAIYWIGLLIIWIEITLILPGYLIISGLGKKVPIIDG